MAKKLNISDPQFFSTIKTLFNQDSREEIRVDNFICKDWNVFYDLGNPENFEDPEAAPEWYDSSDVYEYYKSPFCNSSSIHFYSADKISDIGALEDLIEKKESYESKLLDFFVHYTFGAGGAYAAKEHFEYARKTIELLHDTKVTEKEFIKQNVCLDTVIICNSPDKIKLHFHCGWDSEHGVVVELIADSIRVGDWN